MAKGYILRRPLVLFGLACLAFAAVFCGLGLANMPGEDLQAQEGYLSGRVAEVLSYGVILEDASFGEEGSGQSAGRVLLSIQGHEYLFAGQEVGAFVRLGPLVNEKNPGAFDFRRYMFQKKVMYRAQGDAFAVIGPRPQPGLLDGIQANLRSRVAMLFPGNSAMMQALLLGEKEGLSEELSQAYRRSGAAHVLAVSGLHVGFVVALLYALLFFLPKHSWAKLAAVLLGLLAYALVTGASPSTVRACLMAAASALIWKMGRKPDGLSVIALCAGVMLLAEPRQLLSASFQLSFSAVVGIALLLPRFQRWLGFLPAWLGKALAVSLAAQIGMLVVICTCFGSLPLLSLLTNLLVVPLAGAAVMLGMLCLVASYVFLPLAQFASPFVEIVVEAMNGICAVVAGESAANLPLIRLPEWFAFVWLGLLYMASPFLQEMRPGGRIALGSACASALLIGLALWLPGLFPAELTADFLYVGSADSAIIRKGSATLVVDTGRTGKETVNALQTFGPYVDALFITHGDADHAGGLGAVLESCRVGRVVYPSGLENDLDFFLALKAAGERGVQLTPVAVGDVLWYDGLEIRVLWPEHLDTAQQNRDSLVLHIIDEQGSLLMTADINNDSHARLGLPKASVVKIPHHGSKERLSDQALGQIDPGLCVVSVGPNPYGLPSEETMRSLAGYKWMRTDEQGCIRAVLTAEGVKAQGYAP